jgi:hypothetical protein
VNRYSGIEDLAFGTVALPLPLSVHISRQLAALPAGSDAELFATSIQTGRPTLLAEAKVRDISVAEALELGSKADLSFVVACSDGSGKRRITLGGAVLIAVELGYEQSSMATATLRFLAEASDGLIEPFEGEVLQ